MGPRNKNHKDHKLYMRLISMRQRCFNKNSKGYPYYGGRGIGMCDEWRKDPIVFIEWAHKNGFEDGLEIDRIDNDGDYCPENCHFATHKENCNNKQFDASRPKRKHSNKQNGLPLGVYQDTKSGYYYSNICVGYKQVRLGTFHTPEECHAEYKNAVAYYHKHKTLDGYKRKLGHIQRRKLPIGIHQRSNGRYRAVVDISKKRHNVGTFSTIEAAVNARKEQLKQLTG